MGILLNEPVDREDFEEEKPKKQDEKKKKLDKKALEKSINEKKEAIELNREILKDEDRITGI